MTAATGQPATTSPRWRQAHRYGCALLGPRTPRWCQTPACPAKSVQAHLECSSTRSNGRSVSRARRGGREAWPSDSSVPPLLTLLATKSLSAPFQLIHCTFFIYVFLIFNFCFSSVAISVFFFLLQLFLISVFLPHDHRPVIWIRPIG